MHPDWQTHLDTLNPAAVTTTTLQHHQHDTLLVDLSHLGLIQASGTEWRTFLQGQLSSDLHQLTANQSQISSYNSPKGRIMALLRLVATEAGVWLQLPREILPPIQKRLSMFIMRADVSLRDVSDEQVCFGLTGASATQQLNEVVADLPTSLGGVTTHNGITVVLEAHGQQPSYMVITTVQQGIDLWQQLAPHATHIGPEAWELQQIRAGIPTVYQATQEAFIAQMVNLQLIGGVSFTKGCYTGQEVVARMQHLGTLKRQMYHAHCPTSLMPSPGEQLTSAHSSSGQGAGRIVRVAPSPTGGFEILAVMEIKAAVAGPLFIEGQPDAPLELLPLPYTLASSE